MNGMQRRRLIVLLAASLLAGAPVAVAQTPDDDSAVAGVLAAMEAAVATRDRAAWTTLALPDAPGVEAAFDELGREGVTRAVIRERDRTPLERGPGILLVADAFIETGGRARISTWRIDLRGEPAPDATAVWRLAAMTRLAEVDALYRLRLDVTRQFRATGLVIQSVDFALHLPDGHVFAADTDEGTTALVLLGRATVTFTPGPSAERGQLRIFSGKESLETAVDDAFVRFSPSSRTDHVVSGTLTEVPVDPVLRARARARFDADIGKAFSFDLHDLSAETWSVLPQPGDFLAELATRRFGTLTYARSTSEPEDVSFFDRVRRRNIAVYASPDKLAARGPDYDEDMLAEVDLREFDIDTSFSPEREWIEGRARLRLRAQGVAVPVISLRLAERLTVSSVVSDRFGRLLFLRLRDQASVVVNLPEPLTRGEEITLTVAYRGSVEPTAINQEAVGVQDGGAVQRTDDMPVVPPEPHWLLSTRSSWYPQPSVTDYATGTLHVTVPADFTVVGSGLPGGAGPHPSGPTARTFSFEAPQPVRYLSVVVSRLQRVAESTVAVSIPLRASRPGATLRLDTAGRLQVVPPVAPPIGSRNTVALRVEANRRQDARGVKAARDATDILRFYASLVGDVPYDTFTLAMVEATTPGGHSPGYFAVLNAPPPAAPFVYRSDPANFPDVPEFFLAHELAHQWWGQAVGWKNYHEQWLSEGFAQYFAALFARERHGDRAFRRMLQSFRRWAEDARAEGPISLGYRLGHLRNDGRVFRAVVYNKGALVLHMLRQFIGDEAFLRGLRAFYATHRFGKAGTSDLRAAMSEASGRDLTRFFARWVLEPTLPQLDVEWRDAGEALEIRVTQRGPVFDLPLGVRVAYADGSSEDLVLPVTDAERLYRMPLRGRPRRVSFNPEGSLPGGVASVRRQRR